MSLDRAQQSRRTEVDKHASPRWAVGGGVAGKASGVSQNEAGVLVARAEVHEGGGAATPQGSSTAALAETLLEYAPPGGKPAVLGIALGLWFGLGLAIGLWLAGKKYGFRVRHAVVDVVFVVVDFHDSPFSNKSSPWSLTRHT